MNFNRDIAYSEYTWKQDEEAYDRHVRREEERSMQDWQREDAEHAT